MEKVNERQAARRNHFLRIIAVRAEKVAVIASRDLSLHVRDRELFHSELIQNPWQHAPDPFQNDFLMLSQIHQHPRAAVAIVDHSRISAGRNYLAALELCLMLQRVANKFVEFLGSQELVQDDALCPNHSWRVQHTDAAAGFTVAFLCPVLHGYA